MKLQKDQWIGIARSWLGTEWRHNQRTKGVGVDCICFLEEVAKEAGIDIEPLPTKYNRTAYGNTFIDYLDRNFTRVDRPPDKGDVILFSSNGLFTHVGICTGSNQVIHASQKDGKVVEHSINGIWERMMSKGGIWEVRQWD